MSEMLESVDIGIALYNSDGVEIYCNEMHHQIWGAGNYIPSSFQKDDLYFPFELFNPEGAPIPVGDYPVSYTLATQLRGTRRIYKIYVGNYVKYLQIGAVPLFNTNREFISAMMMSVDVTAQFMYEKRDQTLQYISKSIGKEISLKGVARATIENLLNVWEMGTGCIIYQDKTHEGNWNVLYAHPDEHESGEIISTYYQECKSWNGTVFTEDDDSFYVHIPLGEEGDDWMMGYLIMEKKKASGRADVLAVKELGTEFFGVLSRMIRDNMKRANFYEDARKLATMDPLTGIYNHRAMQEKLHEFAITMDDSPLAAIMLDVDHFRMFNENYGHDIGDLALKTVAHSIQSAVRSIDVVARYGGEEFTILLPYVTDHEVVQIAERVRNAIAQQSISVNGRANLRITASLGYAIAPTDGVIGRQLLKSADVALYTSKHHGRNRVTAFSMTTEGLVRRGILKLNNNEKVSVDNLRSVESLIVAIDMRDGFTRVHSDRVSLFATELASRLGFVESDIEKVRLGSLIHDVGKIGIPDAILRKEGQLTDEQIEGLSHLRDIVLNHHERLDGTGYPNGLQGDEIDLLSQVVSIADVFEAYTAKRSYHAARSQKEGIALLEKEARQNKLNAEYVRMFVEMLQEETYRNMAA
jgi:diguanylate cyclase (GGDEF)-like protein